MIEGFKSFLEFIIERDMIPTKAIPLTVLIVGGDFEVRDKI